MDKGRLLQKSKCNKYIKRERTATITTTTKSHDNTIIITVCKTTNTTKENKAVLTEINLKKAHAAKTIQ